MSVYWVVLEANLMLGGLKRESLACRIGFNSAMIETGYLQNFEL